MAIKPAADKLGILQVGYEQISGVGMKTLQGAIAVDGKYGTFSKATLQEALKQLEEAKNQPKDNFLSFQKLCESKGIFVPPQYRDLRELRVEP